MALAFDSARWEALAAVRTRGDVGDGIGVPITVVASNAIAIFLMMVLSSLS